MELRYVNIHTHHPTGCGIELRAAGVHPWDAAGGLTSLDRDAIAQAQAIGEIGLDYARGRRAAGGVRAAAGGGGQEDAGGRLASGEGQARGGQEAQMASRERQTEVFEAQLALARERGLPVVIHCVRAFEDVMRCLERCEPRAVIFHGFTGSVQQARRALDRGYYLSFGERTFASPKTIEVLREIPLSQLFFETDDSGADIADIYARAAQVRGTGVGQLQKATIENYERIFGRAEQAGAQEADCGAARAATRSAAHGWLERTELLLGGEKLAALRRAHVLVVGLGGVGAYAAEMLARAGVGRMTIADADVVAESNINRQLIALRSTIGRPKVEALAERLRDINPEIELTVINRFIRDEQTDALLDTARYDYVVDAIDTLSPKMALIAGALHRGLPLVSSMGAGAKTDPTRIAVADIAKTHHCPLAHMLRKRLHKIGIRTGFRAVFSPEPLREGAMILCEEQNKKSNVGTISYIPAAFGIACASVVVRDLIGEME